VVNPRLVALLLALLSLTAILPAAPLPPLQPRHSLCQPQSFAAAMGASLAKATKGRIKATVSVPRWGELLGQGSDPACIGLGTANWGNATPAVRWGWGAGKARNLWQQARDRDKRFRGDPTAGAYTGDLLAVLHARGLISEPKLLWNATMLERAVLTRGPAMMSTPIFFDMYFPDAATGRIHPTGDYIGDHWWVVLWFDGKDFWVANSWKGFGPWDAISNVAKISAADMAILFRYGGQGIIAAKPGKGAK